MTKITIGQSDAGPVRLDADRLIESKLLITASSGGGKSWLLRKVLEGVSAKTQTIVIDTEGEFATLREKRDMVLAGPAGEVPAEVRAAGLLCRRLMEMNLSAVVDISELGLGNKRRFVSLFCQTMVDLPRSLWRPCFVCIDESHEFAPEGEKSDSTEAVASLGSKGRKRGYCLLLATQRLAKLNKDVAAECRNQFVGMMNLDVDLKRASDILGFGRDRWTELRDLSPPGKEGEFFAFGPAFEARGVIKLRAGQVETTHPRAGQGRLATPPAPSAKIKGVIGELADLAKKADEEARTLAEAQKQIAGLRRELAAAKRPVATGGPQKAHAGDLEKARVAGQAEAQRAAAATEAGLRREIATLQRQVSRAAKAAAGVTAILGGAENMGLSHILDASPLPAATNGRCRTEPAPQRAAAQPRAVRDDDSTLGKCERAILAVLAQHPDGCTADKLTLLAGYRYSGGFKNSLTNLRNAGLMEGENTGVMRITEAGHAQGPFQSLPVGEALRSYWLNHPSLGKCEREVLAVLLQHPAGLDAATICQQTGYQYSGGFKNALTNLRKAGVMIGKNTETMRATEDLLY